MAERDFAYAESLASKALDECCDVDKTISIIYAIRAAIQKKNRLLLCQEGKM